MGNVVPVDQVSSSVEPVGVGATPLSKAAGTQTANPSASPNNDASKTKSSSNTSSQPSHSKAVVDSMETKKPSSGNGITPHHVWATAICSLIAGSILNALIL